jgi:radical SAM superfamily enzyme YgiQ (UPF0313 family)
VKKEVEDAEIDRILGWDAKLIGIGSICSAYAFSERLAIALKQKDKDVPINIGGSLGLPLKDLWFKHTQVDSICESDGELVLVDLMNNLDNPDKEIPGLHYRTEHGWKGTPPNLPVNLDYISPPDITEIDYPFYMNILKNWINESLPQKLQLGKNEKAWVTVFSRGCVYNCLFCFHFNRKHRRHSIEYISKYVRSLKDEFGITTLAVWDDLIMGNPKWFMELCDALAKENLGIKLFSGGGKANLITKEMAEKMKAANFYRISYGIESGSQAILDEMKKQTTVEQNKQAIKFTTDAGIFCHINMVIGMPGETKQTLKETHDFLIDVVRENNLAMKNVSFSFATAYPGTQLYDIIKSRGFVPDERDYIINVTGVGEPNPVLCNLTGDELKDFINQINFEINNMSLTGLPRLKNAVIYGRVGRSLAKYAPQRIKNIVRNFV